jgi:hypothetical protein
MRLFRRSITVSAVGLIALALAATGAAGSAAADTPSWSPPASLGETVPQFGPQITVDATSGLATAVWLSYNGSNQVVQASTSQRGGEWSPPTDISPGGQDALDPQLAVDATGLVTVLWVGSSGTNGFVTSSTSRNGEAWSLPVEVSLPGVDSANPQLAVDPSGLVTAVWLSDDGNDQIVQSGTSQSGAGWSQPVDVSLAGYSAQLPQLAVSKEGVVTAVWYRSAGNGRVVQSSTLHSGGLWSLPVDVSIAGRDSYKPQVTVDSIGVLTAVWYRLEDSNVIIQSSRSSADGDWSTPVDLSALGGNAYDPQLAVDVAGNVTAIWIRFNDNDEAIVQVSARQATGDWTQPVDLSLPDGDASNPQLLIDSLGTVTATWARSGNSSSAIVQARRLQANGDWSQVADLSLPDGDAYRPQLAADSTGLTTAIWFRNDRTTVTVESSTLAGPTVADPPVVAGMPVRAVDAPATLANTGIASTNIALAGGISLLFTAAGIVVLRNVRRSSWARRG